jgi:Acetoacetate decarboxylase (ADC)
MTEQPAPEYPRVRVQTPMPPAAPTVLMHRRQSAELPAPFDHATATYLFSLLDPSAACGLCEGEGLAPLLLSLPDGTTRAAGFTAVVDYHQTAVGPYREWILGLWVVPAGRPQPSSGYAGPASLAFGAVLAGDEGFTFFSPKMILTETLPIEIGVEHYGIPKERGGVSYERSGRRTDFAVSTATGQRVLKGSVPSSRGLLARLGMACRLARAFGLGAVIRAGLRNELLTTLAGSAKLCAKNALAVGKRDPQMELLLWDERDCRLEVNPENEWGKALRELEFSPLLVCHVPHLAFVLSGPFDRGGV